MNFAPSFLLVLALLLAAAHPGADAKALASVSDKSYTATASGVNGATITKIEIYAGTSLIGSSNASPASATWYAVIPGVTTLTAKAYDSQGATATSAPVTVTIIAAPGETITFLHNDLAGNPIAATDVNGAIVWRESYAPYGDRQKIQAASSANRQWFGGKPQDSETGLSYYGARYYDPFLGRFYGIDAVGFDEKNIHSFNRYAYANNNPYRFIDLDGNAALPVLLVALDVSLMALDAHNAYREGGLSAAAWSVGVNVAINAVTLGTGVIAKHAFKYFSEAKGAGAGAKEGIYEFREGVQTYCGQSCNISERLQQHVDSGKLSTDALSTVKTTEVLGGKTAREVAEHRRIQEITGGVPARRSDAVSNKVDPIGPNRSHLLNDK